VRFYGFIGVFDSSFLVANGCVNISINSDTRGTFIVYDLIGKIIKTETINLGITKLDLSKYPSGIYLMKVMNDSNQTKTLKLIKQ
jgi:Secretion system C-terminal sorting domain